MKHIVLVLSIIVYCINTSGQTILNDTTAINRYTYNIDTTHSLSRLINEGRIVDKEFKTKGGWGTEAIHERPSNTIRKIEYHDNQNQNIYITYYFLDDKIVCIKGRIETYKRKCKFRTVLYYHNDSLISLSYIGKKSTLKQRFNSKEILTAGYKHLCDSKEYFKEDINY